MTPGARAAVAIFVFFLGNTNARADETRTVRPEAAQLQFSIALPGLRHTVTAWVAAGGVSAIENHAFVGLLPFPRMAAVVSRVIGAGRREPLPPLDAARLRKEWSFLRDRPIDGLRAIAAPRPSVTAVRFSVDGGACVAWRETVTRETDGTPRDLVTGYRCEPAEAGLSGGDIEATLTGYRVLLQAIAPQRP